MHIFKSLILGFFLLTFGLLSHIPDAYAAVDPTLIPQAPRVRDYLQDGKSAELGKELSATTDLKTNLINTGPQILNTYFFGFFGIIATIIALQAGIKVLFSNGNEKAFKDGVMTIINAGIGVILIGSSWAIVRLILQVNLGSS